MSLYPRQPARMKLGEILGSGSLAPRDASVEVAGLAMDSRDVEPGDLFLACAGQSRHGLEYAPEAIQRGAAAIAWEPAREVAAPRLPSHIPGLRIARLSERAGMIADRYFGAPSATVRVTGVTGTNGKTSCVHLLASALRHLGHDCGLIGTLGVGQPGALRPGRLTTPDAVTMHAELARMRDSGSDCAAIEVSSHALDQGRVNGVRFHTAVFTNLTRDHLDYHPDMDAYGAAKATLFAREGLEFAVINTDEAFGAALAATLPPAVSLIAVTDGARPGSNGRFIMAARVETRVDGLRVGFESSWGAGVFHSGMLGRFNAANLLAVLAVLLAWDHPLGETIDALEAAIAPPGRMERFAADDTPVIVVDYAHTPDALANALRALREHCAGTLWCVFGCGGERDPGKRPLMGAVGAELADRLVLTDDNPRNEDADGIIADIAGGIEDGGHVVVERDRGAAIRLAFENARTGDVILVAGKGHEAFQFAGGARRAFSDRDMARALTTADAARTMGV